MSKRLLSLSAVLATAAALFAATPASIAEASGRPFVVRSQQQVLINADRAAAHRIRLNWSSCLATFAQRQARAMAARDYAFHSNIVRMFGCRLGSRFVGENVGEVNAGTTALSFPYLNATINNAFMASPHHRANIMGPYRYVATAWFRASSGAYFIAVEFA